MSVLKFRSLFVRQRGLRDRLRTHDAILRRWSVNGRRVSHDRGMQVALQLDDPTLGLLELLDETDAIFATQPARGPWRKHRKRAPSNLQVLDRPHGQTVLIRTYVRKSKLSAAFNLGASQIVRASPPRHLVHKVCCPMTPSRTIDQPSHLTFLSTDEADHPPRALFAP